MNTEIKQLPAVVTWQHVGLPTTYRTTVDLGYGLRGGRGVMDTARRILEIRRGRVVVLDVQCDRETLAAIREITGLDEL